MLKRFTFLAFFMVFPTVLNGADAKNESKNDVAKDEVTKKFLVFGPNETKGQYILRNAPKTVSSAPKVSVEIKKDKAKKSEPEADAPAEVKTEVKPIEKDEKPLDDDDF